MKNGCPTVRCISLFCLLVAFLLGFYFLPEAARAGRVATCDNVSGYLRERTRRASATDRIPVTVHFNRDPDANLDAELAHHAGRVKDFVRQPNRRAIDLGVLVSDGALVSGGVLVSNALSDAIRRPGDLGNAWR